MAKANKNFGSRLAQLRRDSNFSQMEVARRISLNCGDITNRAVSKWENGDCLPDAEQFICLCKIYGIRDVLSTFCDIGANDPLFGLNKLGRERVTEYIELLKGNPEFSNKSRVVRAMRQMPLYDLPVSAGTGVFLDSDRYDLIDIDDDVPENANIAVRISGDSMSPLYNDGQVVYVQLKPELKNGDIGVFVLNGDAYCKKFEIDDNGICLISLNPAYKSIKVSDSYELRIIGKVVG